MSISIVKPNQLRDTLYNASPECCHTDEHFTYGKGVLVGVVGAFMSQGLTFSEAVLMVKEYAPHLIAERAIPQPWLEDFFIQAKEARKDEQPAG